MLLFQYGKYSLPLLLCLCLAIIAAAVTVPLMWTKANRNNDKKQQDLKSTL